MGNLQSCIVVEVTQSGGAERHVIVKECGYGGDRGFWVGICVKGIPCELVGVCVTAFGDGGAIETDLSLKTRTPAYTHTHIDQVTLLL